MKIVGLITEYNPFHKGHEYHIEEALRLTGADKAIVVMSGDFVQRGEPSIMPKHLRAKMALASGVSLVLELPTRFATASAEYFATGAVDLLNQLGCVDYLCFGSECGDISALSEVASVLLEEPIDFRLTLNNYLKNGLSFPKARQLALEQYCIGKSINGCLLSEPNNILGIEYIKALKKLNSSIKPYTIKRESNHYHDQSLGHLHSSATSIRKVLNSTEQLEIENKYTSIPTNKESIENIASTPSEMWNLLTNQLPVHSLDIMTDSYNTRYPIITDDFSLLLHHQLLTVTPEILMQYQDVTIEIANRIIKYRSQFTDISQFIELIKSKYITRSRVSRCLLHILLEIPDFEIHNLGANNHYARVLGFRKIDSQLLTSISKKSSVPLVTKLSQSSEVLPADVMTLLQEDINSSNLYELIIAHKYKQTYIPEPQKTMIIT